VIKGLEPNTPIAKAVKEWAEEKRRAAQAEINVKNVPERTADHARGRLSLADDLLKELLPPEPPKIAEKAARDRSGYR
jgi:hypothetical protein